MSDLITWAAIGARTSESQIHRELASGLNMPVGFKNSTSGNIQVAIDAAITAAHPHHYLSIDQEGCAAVIHTHGNPHCHIILRGSEQKTNYQASYVNQASDHLKKAALSPYLMIDCSHGNSKKNARSQVLVAEAIQHQLQLSSSPIKGIMIESNLHDGNQPLIPPLQYGQSITDECLGWTDTFALLKELAGTVKKNTFYLENITSTPWRLFKQLS